jgi:hypothetical protein
MKPRPVSIGICLALCVATIAGVAVQGRRLDALRADEQQLQLEIQKLNANPAGPEIRPDEANRPGTRPSISPSSELLRLRNQVSMLSRRQRELAAVLAENDWIRARLAEARTNAANVLPQGYIRRSEARFVGYATPEDTLQTMLWAMQKRDVTNLMASVTPEIAREMQKDMERTGKTSEEFFKGSEAISGLNVVGHNTTTNDLIELQVEIVPGEDARTIRFRLINDQWKMDSH